MFLASVYFYLFLLIIQHGTFHPIPRVAICNLSQGSLGGEKEKVLSCSKGAEKVWEFCSRKGRRIGFVTEKSTLALSSHVWCWGLIRWDEMRARRSWQVMRKQRVPSPAPPNQSRFFVLFATGLYLQKQAVPLGSMHPINPPNKYLASTEKITSPYSAQTWWHLPQALEWAGLPCPLGTAGRAPRPGPRTLQEQIKMPETWGERKKEMFCFQNMEIVKSVF